MKSFALFFGVTVNSAEPRQWRFESVPGSYALLDAVYSVRRIADGATLSGRTTSREAASGKSYDAIAAAHSRAVARLADDVATAVRGLAAQPAARVALS